MPPPVDKTGPELPWVQVLADMRRRIEAGEWKPRERMPGVNELSARYGVSSGTVRKVLKALAAERPPLVVIVPRWGTFRA